MIFFIRSVTFSISHFDRKGNKQDMSLKISHVGDRVLLAGVIDENSDFSPLLKETAPLSIDFSGIQRINSIGLRSWMRFMTQWGTNPLRYLDCPVVISDQLAVIPALRGIKSRIASVVSAFIPYDCPRCQHQEDLRVEQINVHPTVQSSVLSPPCPACKSPMELVNPEQLSIFEP